MSDCWCVSLTGAATKGKGNKQAGAAAKAALKGVSLLFSTPIQTHCWPRIGALPKGPQSPYLDYLPQTQDLDPLPDTKIPPKVYSSSTSSRWAQGHHPPSQHRERHEEDRGEQHPCFHRWHQGQQEANQGGVEEALRYRHHQDQHPHPVCSLKKSPFDLSVN